MTSTPDAPDPGDDHASAVSSSAASSLGSADSDVHASSDRHPSGSADFFADMTLDMSDARDFSTPRTDARYAAMAGGSDGGTSRPSEL